MSKNEYVKKFEEMFLNINLMTKLQGLYTVEDEILYSGTFNQLMWRNIHVTFNQYTFNASVYKGWGVYNNFIEKFLKDIPKKLSYVRIVNIDSCLTLNEIDYIDMDLIFKIIAECA